MTIENQTEEKLSAMPDEKGHFGQYGGLFVPETLIEPLDELKQAYFKYMQDPDFIENRLGLAEAYLEDEEPGPACRQLQKIWSRSPPCDEREQMWVQALRLMKRLCETETQDN